MALAKIDHPLIKKYTCRGFDKKSAKGEREFSAAKFQSEISGPFLDILLWNLPPLAL